MSARSLSLVTLTVALGWGVWTGSARAESQDIPHNAPDAHTGPITGHALHGWPFYRQRYGCWAGMNGYGCSSLKSECRFLFGSCRAFYGEPCLKVPPPSPLPPWVNQLYLNGPGEPRGLGGRRAGCNCR
jgi:hypothetical protein